MPRIPLLLLLFQAAVSPPEDDPGHAWDGRVLDAFTAEPLPGVECCLWTEDLFAASELVARTHTDALGSYELPDPEGRGSKLVLSAPGYRRSEVGQGSDTLRLFPIDEPVSWTIVDLEGLPIGDARVRTRQSCRHARPAVEATSDPRGRVVVEDPPPFEDGGDVEVLAAGFGALGKLSTIEAYGTSRLYLPRRRPIRLRLLDDEGRPLRDGDARYQAESGGHPLHPDPTGRVSLDSPFDDRGGVLLARDGRAIDLAYLPADEPTLRFGAPDPGDDAAQLEVVLEGTDGGEAHLLHEEGWWLTCRGERHVPPGRWRVIAGGPFSGVRRTEREIELAPGEERRLVLHVEPEPLLRLTVPETAWVVHVEAGEDSVSLRPRRGGELETHVPPGVPVTVLSQGSDVRREELAPWRGERTVDLRDERFRLEPDAPPSPVELRFVVETDGPTIPDARIRLRALGPELPDLDPAPDRGTFRVPAGTRWEARLSAGGFETRFRSGVARPGGRTVLVVVLSR